MNKLKLFIGFLALVGLLSSTPALALSPPPPSTERLPLIRLYNPTINDHFYTSSRVEADTAVASHGYRIEGEMGYVESYQLYNTEPVIRMWNPIAGKHFYTTSYDESVTAEASGFVREGAVGYMISSAQLQAYPPTDDVWIGTVKVYRLYNSAQRKHFYTVDNSEAQAVQAYGYVLEGQLGGGIYNAQYNAPIL